VYMWYQPKKEIFLSRSLFPASSRIAELCKDRCHELLQQIDSLKNPLRDRFESSLSCCTEISHLSVHFIIDKNKVDNIIDKVIFNLLFSIFHEI